MLKDYYLLYNNIPSGIKYGPTQRLEKYWWPESTIFWVSESYKLVYLLASSYYSNQASKLDLQYWSKNINYNTSRPVGRRKQLWLTLIIALSMHFMVVPVVYDCIACIYWHAVPTIFPL